MSIFRIIPAGVAAMAMVHVADNGAFARAGALIESGQRGQANFELAVSLKEICGGKPGDPERPQGPCHAVLAKRPKQQRTSCC